MSHYLSCHSISLVTLPYNIYFAALWSIEAVERGLAEMMAIKSTEFRTC